MKATGPYQTFDPLSPSEFAALELDILDRGVQVAIEFDEDGNVLDGHHRLAICQKHGITDYPRIVRRGLTEKQKRAHARSLNMARRHLTREQKQQQIQQALKEDPADSDRKIASSLNVDHKTVASQREKLVEGGEIPHVERRSGLDGMPHTRPKMTDDEGGEIPHRLERLFAMRPEYRKLVNELSDVKRRILELGKTSQGLRSRDSAIKHGIDSLIGLLERNVPHAVHSDCRGDGCDECGSKGYITGGEIPQPTEGGG